MRQRRKHCNYTFPLQEASAEATAKTRPFADPYKEESVVEQVVELTQALLHRLSTRIRQIQILTQRRALLAGEENALCVRAVIQKGDAGTADVTAQIHHLRHQIWRAGKSQGNDACDGYD